MIADRKDFAPYKIYGISWNRKRFSKQKSNKFHSILILISVGAVEKFLSANGEKHLMKNAFLDYRSPILRKNSETPWRR